MCTGGIGTITFVDGCPPTLIGINGTPFPLTTGIIGIGIGTPPPVEGAIRIVPPELPADIAPKFEEPDTTFGMLESFEAP